MPQLFSFEILEKVRLQNMIIELLLIILFLTFYLQGHSCVLYCALDECGKSRACMLGLLACSGPWCACVLTCFHCHVLGILASLRVLARLAYLRVWVLTCLFAFHMWCAQIFYVLTCWHTWCPRLSYLLYSSNVTFQKFLFRKICLYCSIEFIFH